MHMYTNRFLTKIPNRLFISETLKFATVFQIHSKHNEIHSPITFRKHRVWARLKSVHTRLEQLQLSR